MPGPIAVLQYNPHGELRTHGPAEDRVTNDSNGSIIAIAYGAGRDAGAKRQMRGQDAKKLCPELQLVTVPTLNGKADLTYYRKCGAQVQDLYAEDVYGASALLILLC
jgi:DNA polymerase eta